MIKAAFFDLDGTLVPYGSPGMTPRLREDLLALRRRGIKLFLATGRSKFDLDSIGMLGDVEFDAYVIYNGLCCYDHEGFYREVSLSREQVAAACDVLRKNPEIVAIFEGINGNYLNQVDDWVRKNFRLIGPQLYPVRPAEEALDETIFQVVPFVGPEKEHLFVTAMEGCQVARWSDYAADIIPQGNGKADGIYATLERYHLRPEEVIAFGDGDNDISMLTIAGIGVAMGNGRERLKRAADYITASVHEDGVSAALRHFGLLEE